MNPPLTGKKNVVYIQKSCKNCCSASCYEMHTLMKLEILTCWWPEDVCVCPQDAGQCRTLISRAESRRCLACSLSVTGDFAYLVRTHSHPHETAVGHEMVFIMWLSNLLSFFSCAVASSVSLPPSHCVVVIFFSFCLQQAAFWTKLLSPGENATFMSSPHFNNSTPEIRHVFLMFCFLHNDNTVEVSLYRSCKIL